MLKSVIKNPQLTKAPPEGEAFAWDEGKLYNDHLPIKILALVGTLFLALRLLFARALLTLLRGIRLFFIWVHRVVVRHDNLLFVKIGFANDIKTIGPNGWFLNTIKKILNFKYMAMV